MLTIVDLLAPYRTIVSDRLHGAIIALMLRKQTALLPVGYHKIRSFYETWMSTDRGAAYVTNSQELETVFGRRRNATSRSRETLHG